MKIMLVFKKNLHFKMLTFNSNSATEVVSHRVVSRDSTWKIRYMGLSALNFSKGRYVQACIKTYMCEWISVLAKKCYDKILSNYGDVNKCEVTCIS